jgi:hypothetical protein
MSTSSSSCGISPSVFQTERKEIKARHNEIQIQRNEIQTKSLDFLRRIEPYQGLAPTPRAVFAFGPLSGLKAAIAAQAAPVLPGCSSLLFVFVSGSSGILSK